MAEKHRISKNAVFKRYVSDMLLWRKQSKLWEYGIIWRMWSENEKDVVSAT